MTHRDTRIPRFDAPILLAGIRNWPAAVWLGMLVAIELLLLYHLSSGRYFALGELESGWRWLLFAHTYSHYFVVGLGLLVFSVHLHAENRRLLLDLGPDKWLIAIHVGAVMAVLGLQRFMPVGQIEAAADARGLEWIYLAAVSLLMLAGIAGFLMFVPAHKLPRSALKSILIRARRPIQVAILLTVFLLVRRYSDTLGNNSELVRAFTDLVEKTTLDLSLFFYSLPGLELPQILTANNGDPILASGNFSIQMAPICAGYQGMMASILFMSVVLVFDWRRLEPLKAIFFAVSVVGMVFIMNAVRIAILFYIGVQAVSANRVGSHFVLVRQ